MIDAETATSAELQAHLSRYLFSPGCDPEHVFKKVVEEFDYLPRGEYDDIWNTFIYETDLLNAVMHFLVTQVGESYLLSLLFQKFGIRFPLLSADFSSWYQKNRNLNLFTEDDYEDRFEFFEAMTNYFFGGRESLFSFLGMEHTWYCTSEDPFRNIQPETGFSLPDDFLPELPEEIRSSLFPLIKKHFDRFCCMELELMALRCPRYGALKRAVSTGGSGCQDLFSAASAFLQQGEEKWIQDYELPSFLDYGDDRYFFKWFDVFEESFGPLPVEAGYYSAGFAISLLRSYLGRGRSL